MINIDIRFFTKNKILKKTKKKNLSYNLSKPIGRGIDIIFPVLILYI